MHFQNRSVNLESTARKNDSDATVVPSQVKLAESTATGTSSPAFSLPLCLFPPRPRAVPSLVPPRGLVPLHSALGRETHPGESNARKRGLAGSGGPVPAPVHCIDMHLLVPEQGRGQCWVMKKWRRWENETASFGLSADHSVCGTECHVWISWINVVKPWIKSYSGREFSLAYGKQHPQLIQSGSWNTGNKYIFLLCFCGSLYNNAWLQQVFSSLSQAALPSLAPQTEILGTATYILAHFWEPSLSLWVDSALQWSLLGPWVLPSAKPTAWCARVRVVSGDKRRAAETTALPRGTPPAALLWVGLPTVCHAKRKVGLMWGSAGKGVLPGTWTVAIQMLSGFTGGVYVRASTAPAPHC